VDDSWTKQFVHIHCNEVHCVGAYPYYTLRHGLKSTEVFMSAVLVAGLLRCRTRRFFPKGGWNHCQYSLHLPWRDVQTEWPW